MSAPPLPKSDINNNEPGNTPVVLEISLTPFDETLRDNSNSQTAPVVQTIINESKKPCDEKRLLKHHFHLLSYIMVNWKKIMCYLSTVCQKSIV
jgi:hypothetical protein